MAKRPRRTRPQPLDTLAGGEAAVVLAELLASHPELRPEADQAARRLLDTASVDDISDDVAAALGNLPLEALATRAGRVRGRGYIHETDAACELIEETVKPFLADLRRRASVGLDDAAVVVATGIVAGLYRASGAEDGTIVGYAGPDLLSELAEAVLAEAAGLGVPVPSDAAERYWPDWCLRR